MTLFTVFRRCGVFLPAQEVNALFRRFDAKGDGHADAQVSIHSTSSSVCSGSCLVVVVVFFIVVIVVAAVVVVAAHSTIIIVVVQ